MLPTAHGFVANKSRGIISNVLSIFIFFAYSDYNHVNCIRMCTEATAAMLNGTAIFMYLIRSIL